MKNLTKIQARVIRNLALGHSTSYGINYRNAANATEELISAGLISHHAEIIQGVSSYRRELTEAGKAAAAQLSQN